MMPHYRWLRSKRRYKAPVDSGLEDNFHYLFGSRFERRPRIPAHMIGKQAYDRPPSRVNSLRTTLVRMD